ncbi:uncharacterized transmembrane protein DDB_G0289901-like isoform X2 [Toxotes jaculatrix]|uniref:uncharacterized transmembrane protein DDB_G0289901-like isoform X2 n=1 Tax=Toxotes jaculatrix TaxID=941984 RepID=UPI001B3AF694|nr:uncharacterized transmembrane protein DDB_G0289901-like isoform X2 [Toxotes jaculatrix]
MDNRLVLVVLVVTLSWMSVNAQNNMTTANMITTENNMTTGNTMTTGNNMTTGNMTGGPGNMTGGPGHVTGGPGNMTGGPGNMTGGPENMTGGPGHVTGGPGNMTGGPGNMTGGPGNMTGGPGHVTGGPGNMTGGPGNMTGGPGHVTGGPGNMTGGPGNMTGGPENVTGGPGNMTGSPGNTTTGNTMTGNTGNTMTGNTTTASPGNTANMTTEAPALIPNTTVETLETPVSRGGCGTERLCAAQPSECNPSNAGSCFFLSARRRSGQNFDFGLSGESEGYLAATLSTDTNFGDNDTTYVCANNNGAVKFFSTVLNNGRLIQRELNVNSVRGRIDGNKIQCTFAATLPTPTTRASGFALSVSTGPFNSTSGELGSPTAALRTEVVDPGNPNATVTNVLSPNTTASPNTTTPAVTTAEPTLTPNTTVETLETPVSREGCGTQRLCAAQPSECNPSNAGSCFFLSARQRNNGQNFDFGLSGLSEGYIAATLSTDTNVGNNDTTYVCANNNGVVKFFSTVLNNGRLIERVLNVNSVRGRVNGTKIQCTFAATVVTPSTRAPTVSISISNGTFNSTSGQLGDVNLQFRSGLVDLANANATVTNELNTTTTPAPTTPPSTTSHAITFQQSLTQALLITVGVLGLAML